MSLLLSNHQWFFILLIFFSEVPLSSATVSWLKLTWHDATAKIADWRMRIKLPLATRFPAFLWKSTRGDLLAAFGEVLFVSCSSNLSPLSSYFRQNKPIGSNFSRKLKINLWLISRFFEMRAAKMCFCENFGSDVVPGVNCSSKTSRDETGDRRKKRGQIQSYHQKHLRRSIKPTEPNFGVRENSRHRE